MTNEIQYVGARYVPKFASPNTWQSGTSYEALTIVQYNNASYTSKVPVPATVGNPASNPDYWVLTGNYNGQVEQYRQEVVKTQNDIKNVQNDVDANTQMITENKANINVISNKVNYKKVVCIGDSYGQGVYDGSDHISEGWVSKLSTLMPNSNVINYTVDGAGFTGGHPFSDQVTKAINDGNSDADLVIIQYGANDIYSSDYDNLFNKTSSTLTSISSTFKSAKIIGFLSSCCYPTSVSAKQKFDSWHNINTAFANAKIPTFNINTYLRCYGAIISNDYIHYTAYGYTLLAKLIYQIIYTGVAVKFERTIHLTGTTYLELMPDNSVLYRNGQLYETFDLNTKYDCTGDLTDNVLYSAQISKETLDDARGISNNADYLKNFLTGGAIGYSSSINKPLWVNIAMGNKTIDYSAYSINCTGTSINGYDSIPAGTTTLVVPRWRVDIPTYFLC